MLRQRRAAAPPAMVERRIYFYRVGAGLDDAGRPLPFDPAPVFRHVGALPFSAEGRYWEDGDGNATCCWVDREADPCRLRFGTIRRSGFPQVERAGALSALNIPAMSGLVEQVHVAFFPNQIVGSEFNFYGPRIPHLARYLSAKARDICPLLTFQPLLRQDVADQLARLRTIRMVRLRIRASYASRIAQANRDLGEAFKAAQRAGDADELEIVLKSEAYSRRPLSVALLDAVKRLAGHDDLRTEVSRFDVKGVDDQSGQVELVDILSDQLIARAQIVCLDRRARALDPASAYAAIERAHEELRDQLLIAAGVSA